MATGAIAGMLAAMQVVRRKLKKAGATSKEKAITAEEAGIAARHEICWLNHCVEIGQVRQTEDGKYYIE